jgi:hypothetical protein
MNHTSYDKLIAQGYKALRLAARRGQGIDFLMLSAPLGRIEKGIRELHAALEHGPYGDIKPGIQRRAGRLVNHFDGERTVEV